MTEAVKLKLIVVPPLENQSSQLPEDEATGVFDAFGGEFSRKELLEDNTIAPNPTPTVEDPKIKAIMQHVRKTHSYPEIQISSIKELATGGVFVSGVGISKDAMGNPKRRDFTTSYSKFEYEQVQKRLKDLEGNHGVLYNSER